jgi:cytochrome b involved in lipid metabolism
MISLFVFLYQKQSFPKMESMEFSLQVNSTPKSVRSIKELNQDKNYVVFSNFVYDIAPLKHNHPAGNEVINYIKNQ